MTATTSGENRAAVLYAPGDLRVEDRAIPEPGLREVLVEIAAVGVCGSDVHYYEHGRIGSFVVREPMVLGHESSGRVVALGPGASRHVVGDRVARSPAFLAVTVASVGPGATTCAATCGFFATPPIDGAFANYVTIHEDFAFALPEFVSDEAGALMEPLSVAVWACQRANVTAGDRVLVTGAGPIGLLAVQTARAFGATAITVTDINPHRLAVAERTGATSTINVAEAPLEDSGVEADALIECSGHPGSLKAGIAALRPAGRAVLVGMGPEEDGVVPLALIQNRELWLTGTFRYANTYPTAIALAANGRADLEAIITGQYGLDDAEAALRAGREDPAAVKVMVMPAGRTA
jgi:L-iditol 2-dehydrogenase